MDLAWLDDSTASTARPARRRFILHVIVKAKEDLQHCSQLSTLAIRIDDCPETVTRAIDDGSMKAFARKGISGEEDAVDM